MKNIKQTLNGQNIKTEIKYSDIFLNTLLRKILGQKGNSDIINKKNTNHRVLTILHTGFIYKYPLLLFFIFYFIYYSFLLLLL